MSRPTSGPNAEHVLSLSADGHRDPVLRVLIVDDHSSFRSMAARLLTASGFRVVGEAADGVGAVSAVRELHPDVVLLDVQLPGIDGFRVAGALAGQRDPPNVVLMSSRAQSDYGSRVADAPVRGFIPKAELNGCAVRRLLDDPGTMPGIG